MIDTSCYRKIFERENPIWIQNLKKSVSWFFDVIFSGTGKHTFFMFSISYNHENLFSTFQKKSFPNPVSFLWRHRHLIIQESLWLHAAPSQNIPKTRLCGSTQIIRAVRLRRYSRKPSETICWIYFGTLPATHGSVGNLFNPIPIENIFLTSSGVISRWIVISPTQSLQSPCLSRMTARLAVGWVSEITHPVVADVDNVLRRKSPFWSLPKADMSDTAPFNFCNPSATLRETPPAENSVPPRYVAPLSCKEANKQK